MRGNGRTRAELDHPGGTSGSERVLPFDPDIEPDKAEQWFINRYANLAGQKPWILRKRKHGKIAPTVAVLDTETDPFAGPEQSIAPFVAGFYDGSIYVSFWGDDCVAQLVAHIRGYDAPLLIYAHNGGKFDFRFMLDHIEPEVFTIDTRIVRCYIAGDAAHCDPDTGDAYLHELRDSFALLPVALDMASDKVKFDYDKMLKSRRDRHRVEILEYLKKDCTELYDTVTKARGEFGNALTMASAAMRKLNESMVASRKGKERKVYERLSEEQDAEIRPFYYGGHVECFARGIIERPFKLYDIRSSYPDVMRNKLHPISAGYRKGLRAIDDDTDFARVLAYSDGALPLRNQRTKALEFPRGTFEFAVTGHELRMGLKLGLVKLHRIIDAWSAFERTSFAPFIDHYFRVRMEAIERGDKVYSLFWKLVMNGAYGKFAQNPRVFKDTMICRLHEKPPLKADGWTLSERYELMDIYTRPSDPKFAWRSFLNVGTGASITGAARASLMLGIASSKGAVYCDTDSLICEHLDPALIGEGLGKWQLEKTGDRVAVAEKKLYALFDGDKCVKMASKGVRVSPDDIVRVCGGETVTYTPLAPTIKLDGSQVWTARKIRMITNALGAVS